MKRIFLIGYMGSGKTTYGGILAKELGLSFIDLDVYIEKKYFKTVSEIFKERGEDGFRVIEREMLHEVMAFENVLVAAGGGTPCFFDNIVQMNASGKTVYLKSSPAFLAGMLRKAKQNRPLISEKTDEELQQYIAENLARREPFYSQASVVVDCDADPETVLARLRTAIG